MVPSHDVFHLKRTSGITLHDADEVHIDAEGGDITVSEREGRIQEMPKWSYALINFPGVAAETVVSGYPRDLSVRNAHKATITGTDDDERFDISAKESLIRGRGGRNVYLLRNGNRIEPTSQDVAIWTRGVSGAVIDIGVEHASSVLLKVDVPHEGLAFRREGVNLVILVGEESLTLERYFERPMQSAQGTDAKTLPMALALMDAFGTVVSLVNPLEIGSTVVPMTRLDKHLMLPAELPASRRTLSGDDAYSRIHLTSGAGDLRVAPMTRTAFDIVLAIPVTRLRYRTEGDDLIIVETPPEKPPGNFAPLQLRLPRQRIAGEARLEGVTVWANDQDKAPAILALPTGEEPEEGAMTVGTRIGNNQADAGEGAAQPAPADSTPTPGQGTTADDMIDARTLSEGAVLSGGEGSDTYWIKAGQSLVIDNFAADARQDILRVDGIDRKALMEGIRFTTSEGALEIGLAGGKITVKNHVTQRAARHLSLEVEGARFALPVLARGFMVHLPSATNGDVLATAPGAHLVHAQASTPWSLAAAPTTVWLRQSAEWLRHGASAEARGAGAQATTVTLIDYHRAPERWLFKDVLSQVLCGPEPDDQAVGVHRIKLDLLSGRLHRDKPYPVEDVRAYLEARGMPRDIALNISGDTLAKLRRMHELLIIGVDGGDWVLPASFIDGYAESDVTLASDQGAVLRHLASNGWSWTHAEHVLRGKLTLDQVKAFESWVAARVTEGIGSAEALPFLRAFVELAAGALPANVDAAAAQLIEFSIDGSIARPASELDATVTNLVTVHAHASLLAKILELKGRPAAAAEELASAMIGSRTMDESWIAGMLNAGVADPALLYRLRVSGLTPQDVVLGNANRQRYEGESDRSALITVDGSPAFREPSTSGFEYRLTHYLKLDSSGKFFERQDLEPQAGVDYDLVPGVIVDQDGGSPDPAVYEKWGAEVRWGEERKAKAEEERRTCPRGFVGWYSNGSDRCVTDPYDGASSPSSVVYLARKMGLAVVQPKFTAGAWGDRTSPEYLVDGFDEGRDVTAWRPAGGPHIALDATKFVDFKFGHAIALTSLKLSQRLKSSDEVPEPGVGSWQVFGLRPDGKNVPVSEVFEIEDGNDAKTVTITTSGVPYFAYRLQGVSGLFPGKARFSEVTFTTADVGEGHGAARRRPEALSVAVAKPAVEPIEPTVLALVAGGFTQSDAHALHEKGVRTDEQVAHANELRQYLGQLPVNVIAEDVKLPRLAEKDLQALDRQRQSDSAQYRLSKLRRQGPGCDEVLWGMSEMHELSSHLRRSVWRFYDPRGEADGIGAKVRALLGRALEGSVNWTELHLRLALLKWPYHGFWRDMQRCRPPVREDVTSGSTPWMSARLRGIVSIVDAEDATKHAVFAKEDHSAFALFREAIEAWAEELQGKGATEAEARRAAWEHEFYMAVICAARSGHPLYLHVPMGHTAQDREAAELIQEWLPLLQRARDAGAMDVAIVSPVPSGDGNESWTAKTVGEQTLYISSAESLEDAWRVGLTSQPIPRLKAGGYSEEEAQELYDKGVRTPEQVAHANDLRRHLGKLSVDHVLDDLKLPRLVASQHRMASYLLKGGVWTPATTLRYLRRTDFSRFRVDDVDRLVSSGLEPVTMEGDTFLALRRRMPEVVRATLSALRLRAAGQDHEILVRRLVDILKSGWRTEPGWRSSDVFYHLEFKPEWRAADGGDALYMAMVLLEGAFGRASSSPDYPWRPKALDGMVSLFRNASPSTAPSKGVAVALSLFERVLDMWKADLQSRGKTEWQAWSETLPQYLRLAVLHASITGKDVVLHVPAGATPTDMRVRTLIEGVLPKLQELKDHGFIKVTIASLMRPAGEDKAWTLAAVGDTDLHVTTPESLMDAWRVGVAAQAIPRLIAGGFSEADAKGLYEQGIDTVELVQRAIEQGRHFIGAPVQALAKELLNNAFRPEQLELAKRLDRLGMWTGGEKLDAVVGTMTKRMRLHLLIDDLQHGLQRFSVESLPTDRYAQRLGTWLTNTIRPDTIGHFVGASDRQAMGDHILAALNDFGRLGQALDVAERVIGDESVLKLGGPPTRLNRHVEVVPTAHWWPLLPQSMELVLSNFSWLLDEIHADRVTAGHCETEVRRVLDPLALRLGALYAAVTGGTLRLGEPDGDSAEAKALRAEIRLLREPLEEAERLGILNVDIQAPAPAPAPESEPEPEPESEPAPESESESESESAVVQRQEPLRQASLLKQELAAHTGAGHAGSSSFAPPQAPSPLSQLTGQAA